MVGATAQYSASLTPTATGATYAWTLNGVPIGTSAATVSVSPTQVQRLMLQCVATVGSQRVTAQVQIAATAAPNPTPTPTDCRGTVDPVFAAALQQIAAQGASDSGGPVARSSVYPFVEAWVTYIQQVIDARLSSSGAAAQTPRLH